MRPKLVTLIVAGALTTGWLLASIVSPPVAELQGLPSRTERRVPARDAHADAPFTEQLHLKLQTAPLAPMPRRNPFVFGSARRATEARDAARSPGAVASTHEPAPVPVPSGPSLRLAGIGATNAEGGPIRTAIISDGTTVHLVKVGETVTGYAVVAITDDTVTIENAAGAQWTLRLK